jgi:hypothetical protein
MKEVITILVMLLAIMIGAWLVKGGWDRIEQHGLKSVVEEIWEGKKGKDHEQEQQQ